MRHNKARDILIVALASIIEGDVTTATGALQRITANKRILADAEELIEELDEVATASAKAIATAAEEDEENVLDELDAALASDEAEQPFLIPDTDEPADKTVKTDKSQDQEVPEGDEDLEFTGEQPALELASDDEEEEGEEEEEASARTRAIARLRETAGKKQTVASRNEAIIARLRAKGKK